MHSAFYFSFDGDQLLESAPAIVSMMEISRAARSLRLSLNAFDLFGTSKSCDGVSWRFTPFPSSSYSSSIENSYARQHPACTSKALSICPFRCPSTRTPISIDRRPDGNRAGVDRCSVRDPRTCAVNEATSRRDAGRLQSRLRISNRVDSETRVLIGSILFARQTCPAI
jgi:hypothetical protein